MAVSCSRDSWQLTIQDVSNDQISRERGRGGGSVPVGSQTESPHIVAASGGKDVTRQLVKLHVTQP